MAIRELMVVERINGDGLGAPAPDEEPFREVVLVDREGDAVEAAFDAAGPEAGSGSGSGSDK